MMRPTYKELNKKLTQAKSLISKDKIRFLEQDIIVIDALELGYEVKNIKTVLLELLSDVTPRHYVGSYPPQKSYEENILDRELFAFKVASKRFGCEIYVKYALKDNFLWLVSLHQHRDKE